MACLSTAHTLLNGRHPVGFGHDRGQCHQRRPGHPPQTRVAGLLSISGKYTQTATGSLNVELGGTTAGSQYDELVVSGTAMLGGTVNVSLINGFQPAPATRSSP